MPPSDPVADQLDRRLASIEHALASVSSGASLCTISRSAGSVPGAKYLEGQMAAVLEVRRGVGAGRPLGEVLDERASAWAVELSRVAERSMGPDWLAYRAGGVDELESMRNGEASEPTERLTP